MNRCGCDAGFTCTRCRGTSQHDDWHREFAYEPDTPYQEWVERSGKDVRAEDIAGLTK